MTPGFLHTFRRDFSQKSWTFLSLAWHVLGDFKLDVLRQHVLRTTSSLDVFKFESKQNPFLFIVISGLCVNQTTAELSPPMGPVRIRHHSHHFATQPSHSVILNRVGWQAKMASIEFWIPWRNVHDPHWS